MLQDKSALESAGYLRFFAVVVSLVAAVGCSDEATPLASGNNNAAGDDGKWCDALEILRTECQECHSKDVESTAPMPLDTYKDLLATGITDKSKKVYELVSERIHDTKRPMPEPPRTLSKAQLAALDAWIEAGALPGSDPTCSESDSSGDGDDGDGNEFGDGDGDGDSGDGDTGDGDSGDGDTGDGDSETPVSADWPTNCDGTYKVLANDGGKAHAVAANSQTHPQFYFDAPWGDEPVQAIAFRPITDNKKVLHHWILYENGSGSASGGNFLTGWSPGKDGVRNFPEDIGVYMPSGTRVLRLDTHYYNQAAGSKAETDSSGVEICVVHKEHFRKNTASTFAFGTAAFRLDFAPPENNIETTCDVTTTGGSVYLLNSSPHMHKLGVWAKFARTRDRSKMMLQDTKFSFEFQEGKTLDRLELKTGDVMTTECDYINDTMDWVMFGPDTEDEMCFNFAMYYPMGALKCPMGVGRKL